jgi:hypothetical protein
MIRIAISQAAFDAIASTLPLGSVAHEQEANAVIADLDACLAICATPFDI